MLVVAGLGPVLTVANAQNTADYAVQVSAVVQSSPARISLSWPADPQATAYSVYRKSPDSSSWGSPSSLAAAASTYVDNNVAVGSSYEYWIHKTATGTSGSFSGDGYILAGIQSPPVESRGKVILLIDQSFSASLSSELAGLQQDLIGDGWLVLRHDVARTATVPSVKAIIQADYNADPANVKAVFLLGHVPVPYSGDFAPDGHTQHVGAWPADVYYGDMDGTWTDSSVTSTGATDPRNWNVPGDGKFDQSTLPSDVELQVGRVDFAQLPAFAKSETELLRQYLNKDHNFRFRVFQVDAKAVVNDHFGTFNGEAFAANGYRNAAPLVGAASVTFIPDWTGSLSTQACVWAYGCGPGDYSGASGVTSTSDLATNDPHVVFTMLFGSYLGDWDSQDNLMRAALATPTYTLTCAWVGRPWWQFHHMGLGGTIGYSTRLSQNNSTTYAGGQRTRGIHVALMGDPTLRMQAVAPPQNLFISTSTSQGVDLRWSASADPVSGYYVYRAPSAAGPFVRLTSIPLSGTSYSDSMVGSNVYMVRALKLETSASGTYSNLSQGIFQTLSGSAASVLPQLTLQSITSSSFLISGKGVPGTVYRIEALDGALGTNWQTLGSATSDISGVFRFSDSSSSRQRSYRTCTDPSSP